MRCPNCGIEQYARESFCEHCGSYMDLPATAAIGEGSLNTRSLIPGARLQNDRYVIKKVLGQGGMGSVFLATDTRLAHKLVVVKALISDDMDPTRRQEDVRNFKHEVETLAHLDHPLIPSVTDHFQEGSHYFMVQEYVEGETLQARMDRFNQPMKEHAALRYASEVLDILDYLSQQVPAIVHRDIKPANIIIGAKDRRAHLVDFGIARKDTPSSTRRKQTTALGTPGYAPPEQYQGNADPRSDLYALAATVHYLLTNHDPGEYVPFQYPPVRQLNPQLSPDTEVLLALALTIDANQRYQSAQAMKRDIENILLRYFEITGDRSSYESGYSIPVGANPRLSRASQPVRVQQQLQVHPMQLPVNHPPVTPYQPLDMYAGVEHWLSRSNVGFHFVLFVLFISLIAAAAFVAIGYVF